MTLAELNVARARRFRYNGEWRTVREVSALTGIPIRTLYTRIAGDELKLGVFKFGPVPKTHAFRGEQLTARQIADRTGLSESAVYCRLMNGRFVAYGEMEELPRDPPINARFVVWKGRKQTVSAWAREYGLSPVLVHNRLNNSWSIERALTTPPAANRRRTSTALSAAPDDHSPALPPGGTEGLSSPLRGPATSGTKIIHNQNEGVTP